MERASKTCCFRMSKEIFDFQDFSSGIISLPDCYCSYFAIRLLGLLTMETCIVALYELLVVFISACLFSAQRAAGCDPKLLGLPLSLRVGFCPFIRDQYVITIKRCEWKNLLASFLSLFLCFDLTAPSGSHDLTSERQRTFHRRRQSSRRAGDYRRWWILSGCRRTPHHRKSRRPA